MAQLLARPPGIRPPIPRASPRKSRAPRSTTASTTSTACLGRAVRVSLERSRAHPYELRNPGEVRHRRRESDAAGRKENEPDAAHRVTAVNMMGSGIIMLPTNMAQGRRHLPAVVDRDGVRLDGHRLRVRAGRPVQPAHRRHVGVRRGRLREAGLLHPFYLYFLSLAIGNVAIAISAVGYLATLLPVAGRDPDRDVHWRDRADLAHDVRELRRSERDRKDRLHHGLGRHPSSRPALDHRLVLVQRRYLLGRLEPAGAHASAQGSARASRSRCGRSSAWNPPRRTRPPWRIRSATCRSPACSARSARRSIYILSTTVIQGIVPNAELAASTGPSGSPTRTCSIRHRSIVMGLAVLACLGSLLGWQFTIAHDREVRRGRADVPDLLHEGEPAWARRSRA